jgi:DNA-binding MarR family transcriptional regulator
LYAGYVTTKPAWRPEVEPPSTSEIPGSDHLGHLLWETYSLVHSFSEPLMDARTPLSAAAIGALAKIATFPGITASGLARQGFKTQQAASQTTGRLERLGLVERRLGASRGVELYITPAGERALAEGLASELDVDGQLEALIGSKQAVALRALLKDLRQALVDAGVD